MSTHTTVTGTVTLDAAAWRALRTLRTGARIAADDGTIGVDDDSESTVITFDDHYRNIGHLGADLTLASYIGTVTGTLQTVTTDGDTCLTVTRWAPGVHIVHGDSGCLNVDTVTARRVVGIHDGPIGSLGLTLYTPLPHLDGRVETVDLPVADVGDVCACGGYTDDGEPICASEAPTPMPTGYDPSFTVEALDAALTVFPWASNRRPPLLVAIRAARFGYLPYHRDESWITTWTRALTCDVVPPGAITRRNADHDIAEPVALALLHRGVDVEFDHMEPISARDYATLTRSLLRQGDLTADVAAAMATHPHLTLRTADALASSPRYRPVVDQALAANPACPEQILRRLPATVVSRNAPQRIATDGDIEAVRVLGGDWDGDADSLAEAIDNLRRHRD